MAATKTAAPDDVAAAVPPQAVDAAWAWAAYQPDDRQPWDLRRTAHLVRRAAFGGTWGEPQQALKDGPAGTIDRLVRPPGEMSAFQKSYDGYDQAAGSSGADDAARAWWLRRMIETPHPLLEKMTLFWHSHFGISRARVPEGAMMASLVHLLRRHALGSYAEMLAAALREPAVVRGLDADGNRRGLPNSNLAQQLLAQYGPGTGEFDEQDVRETTRALTGWLMLRSDLRFVDREFDTGAKRILGQAGNWKADDAVRIVLQQPATARHIVRSMYRWLIAETDEPEAKLLEPLAVSFHKDYDIGRLVETMLRSNWFFSAAAYRQRVRSPVELALGMIRPLEGNVPTLRLGGDLAGLGQDLLRPPTVKGWLGGRCWLNPAAMMGRVNLTASLLTPDGAYGAGLDPQAVAQRHGHSDPAAAVKFLAELLLGGDVPAQVRDQLAERAAGSSASDLPGRLRELVQDICTLAEFQLA
jgi:uncharacterized protein (DUF1800 family)